MMRKGVLALWVLMVALAVILAGCGGGATPAPAGSPSPAQATPKPVEPATVAKPQPTSELIGGATVVMGATIEPTDTPKPIPTRPPTATPVPPTSTKPATAAPAATATEVATPTEAPPAGPVEVPMVEIPAGEFVFGSDKQPAASPQQTVNLPAFSIDVYEVTNEQFAAFVATTGYQTTAEKAKDPSWKDYAGEGKEHHPVVKVSWFDAEAYCQWAGKRLPTEQEWEKAARGTDGRLWPWGNEFDPEKANGMESGYRGTLPVGTLPAGASPYGVMDMAGNVAEWTADWYKPYPGSSYRDQYMGEKFRITRGGGWFSDESQVQTFFRNSTSPEAANDDLGFRCAR
ncbi:MAG: SUMF1/EgtB/PvdO family nonheme iron enzyme [Anaerolineae bacterium]